MKPNNLLLSDTGVLKIADLGLARNFGEMVPMTPTVVTRWYRAPELLFGAQYYGASIDIWASGCIFAELMLRVPYFAADTDIDQLKTIFKARGTPAERDWPVINLYKGMKSLPNFLQFDKFEATPSRTLFTAAGDDALSLLDSMLSMDPNKRPSAAHCLRHDYFKTLPRPTRPSKLPRIAPSDADDPGQNKRKFEDDGEFGSGVKRRLF